MIFEAGWKSIYRFKTRNVGDLMCAPSSYFKFPKNKKIDVLESEYYDGSDCVVGGGGIIIFDNRIRDVLHMCKSSNKRMIMWGAGHNSHRKPYDFSFPGWIGGVDLVGMRDFDSGFEWVPCASCMHPAFDKKAESVRDFGFYGHFAIPVAGLEFERLNNGSFAEVIKYLGESENVITNSYHGAYWATLLGKKVITYPNSTKFFRLKHPPVLLETGQDWTLGLSGAVPHHNALDECRNANLNFYEKCKKLFS